MKKRSKGEKRRQAAAVLAVFLAVLMVLGVLSPLFAAMAYGAEPTYQGEVQQADGTFEEVPSDRFAVTAEVGYEIDGVRRYIVQETTPVFFHVQNHGEAFQGELQMRVNQIYDDTLYSSQYLLYYLPVDLAAGEEQDYSFSVPIPLVEDTFSVRLVTETGEVVYSGNISARPSDWRSQWTGIVSDAPEELSYFKQIDQYYNDYYKGYAEENDVGTLSPSATFFGTAYVAPEELSSRQDALANFHQIVLNDVNTQSMTQEQLQALFSWVEDGGVLLIGTGAAEQKVLTGLSAFLSVTRTGELFTQTVELDHVGPLTLDLSRAHLTDVVVAADGKTPLVTAQQLGKGTVFLFAWDLGKEPASSAAGMADFVRDTVLSYDMSAYDLRDGTFQDEGIQSSLQEKSSYFHLPDLDGLWLIIGILAVYAVVIGPVLYLILKKVDKREKAYVLIPTGAVVLCGVIFLLGHGSIYQQGMVSTASYLALQPGEKEGMAETAVSVAGGRQGELLVEFPEPISFYALNANVYYGFNDLGLNRHTCCGRVYAGAEPVSQLTFWNNEGWNVNSFSLSTPVDLGGDVAVSAELRSDGAMVTVKNNTRFDLEDLVFRLGIDYAYLDYLGAGETGTLTISSEEMNTGDRYSNLRRLFPYGNGAMFRSTKEKDYENYLRYQLIDDQEGKAQNIGGISGQLYAFVSYPIWTQTPTVNGHPADCYETMLLGQPVMVQMDAQDGYSVPYGIWHCTDITDESGQSIDMDYSYQEFYADHEGTVTARFDLGQLQPDTFAITWDLWGYSNNGIAPIELYCPAEQAWQAYTVGTEVDAATYMDAQGQILVRTMVRADITGDAWMNGALPQIMFQKGGGAA
ncbi:MAG TPA: hypothetical protein H9687_03320 [Firmicutes bacterium]|nr:hypothetical protein [Bacillota bacterium]